MANYLSPFSSRQFIDANGNPYSGALLFTYVSGSTTKVTTYKDEAGSSSHANPIVLNTRGEPADGSAVTYPIWQIGSASVKFVLAPSTDTDPPASPIATWDNIDGINDTSVTVDQWISGPTTTYVSATSFTLAGDQTSTFHIGRRIKTSNSGGTIYSTITNSVYGASTTVTVVNDSGTLDSGLSAVSYGILSSANTSIPGVEISGDDWTHQGNVTVEGSLSVANGFGPSHVQNYSLSGAVGSNALTITLSGYDGTALSATNVANFTFGSATAGTGTSSVVSATANLTLVISSGSTLGATSAVPFRVWIGIANDGGTLRLVARNCSTSTAIYGISDDSIISSTAEGGAGAADSAGVWYSGTAVTSKSVRIIGYLEFSLTTAGTWDEVPDKIRLWQTGMKLPGDVVQVSYVETASQSSTTSTIPFDNTIPQITEGAELFNASMTATSLVNLIEINSNINFSTAAAAFAITAIFNGASDALVSSLTAMNGLAGTSDMQAHCFTRYVVNSVASKTYSLRYATEAGTNIYTNSHAASAAHGGSLRSYMCIKEIQA